MKRLIAIAFLLAAGSSSAFAQNAQLPPALRIEMYDGTRLNGPALEPGIRFSSSLGENLVPWDQIAEVALNKDAAPSRNAATDGDSLVLVKGGRLNGRVKTTVIGVSTALGKARLPLATIRRIGCQSAGSDVPPPGGVAPSAANLREGLVLYFPFDKEARGVVKDESGHDNDGRRNGGRFVADGLFRGAYEFGGQDYIEVQSSSSLCPQEISLSAWVRPARDVNNEGRLVVSKGANMSGYFFGAFEFDGGCWTSLMLCGPTRAGMYTYAKTKRTLKRDTWHHLCATFDGRNQRLYLNGELMDSAEHRGPIQHSQNVPLTVGIQVSPHVFGWVGLIDELRIYSRGLSEAEVRQLGVRNAPAPVAAATAANTVRNLHVEIELTDSTTVKGTAAWTTLPLTHSSLGVLNIPWHLVVTLAARDGGNAEIALSTGDILVGQMQFEKAGVDSALGRVAIARDQIRAIRVVQPGTDAAESASAGPVPGPAAAGSAPAIPPKRSVREDGATRF